MGKLLRRFQKQASSLPPPIVVFFSFFLVILIGAILLTLPIASETRHVTSFIDALYTSTSATCVTGLVVFDTADYWSRFGEVIILLLIQIGGLGLITLMTFFMSVMGRKSGLKTMILAQESLNTFDWQDSIRLIRGVVIVVFGLEFIGTVLLAIAFVPQFGAIGLYYGAFHAVSAFCNAGFDVLGGLKSMSDYNGNPLILYTIDGLIMVGGLGFIVWQDIWSYRKTRKLQIHSKLVLIISAVLWIGGALFIYIVERQNVNTLGSMTSSEQVNAAFFLSVNARTAGYASFDLNAMNDVTKVFTSVLMFIGAASGSTGGGIKVNTLGVIIIALVSVVRAREQIVFNKRHIPTSTVLKAFTVMLLSGTLLLTVTMLISLINPEFRLVNSLFESTSAFGTVGLSIGMSYSPDYGTISKIIHILTMFIGRVGPMTFAITLTLGKRRGNDIVYPDGKIVVG
jgi:trk system potassium uptake protein TrkH